MEQIHLQVCSSSPRFVFLYSDCVESTKELSLCLHKDSRQKDPKCLCSWWSPWELWNRFCRGGIKQKPRCVGLCRFWTNAWQPLDTFCWVSYPRSLKIKSQLRRFADGVT